MGYSASASVNYGIDLTNWVESGDIFSKEDWNENNIPDFTFTNVSLKSVFEGWDVGLKVYLECAGWGCYSDCVDARDFGETIGTGSLPSAEEISIMNANLQDAIAKIAKHYDVEIPDVKPGLVVKASFG